MDLSNWNVFFEQWGATIGAYGGLVIIGLKTFILDPIKNRKNVIDVSNIKSFVTTSKEDFKQIGKIVYDGYDDFKTEIINSVVTPLVEELKHKDTQQAILNNIIITLVSSINVPLEMKEQTFKALSQLDGVNTPYLEQAIKTTQNQIKAKNVEVDTNAEIVEKLKVV